MKWAIAALPDQTKAHAYYSAVLDSKGKESAELRTAARKAILRLTNSTTPVSPSSESSGNEEVLEGK